MAVLTYSRYEDGHQREIPPEARQADDDDLDEYELNDLAEACASDDHSNHDGWEGDHSERTIHLFCNGRHHSTYTVTVEYEPVFSAQRAQAQKEKSK